MPRECPGRTEDHFETGYPRVPAKKEIPGLRPHRFSGAVCDYGNEKSSFVFFFESAIN